MLERKRGGNFENRKSDDSSDVSCEAIRSKILTKDKIYINESLTYTNRQRFNKCLQFKKLNNWAYIWTQNGATLLKKNSESNIVAIKSDLDPQKLK